MPNNIASPPQQTRWVTIGIVVGLHAALLLAWRHTREQAPERDQESGPRIQWIDTSAPKTPERTPEAAPPPAAVASTAPLRTQRQRRDAPAPPSALPSPASATPPVPESEASAITVVPPDPFAEPAAAPDSADTIRKRAFADLGKIDKDLRKASLNKFEAPGDSPQKRLIAGIQSARRNPTLFEKAEIEEVTTGNADAGGRRYKIKTGLGTFCMTTAKVTDEKRDMKYTNCPK